MKNEKVKKNTNGGQKKLSKMVYYSLKEFHEW